MLKDFYEVAVGMSTYDTIVLLISEYFCSRGYEPFLSAMVSSHEESRIPPAALYCATLWSIVKNNESERIKEAVKLITDIFLRVPDIGKEKRSRHLLLDLKCKALLETLQCNVNGQLSDASLQADLNRYFPPSVDPTNQWYQTEHRKMRTNLVGLLTAPPHVRKSYLNSYSSDNEDSLAIRQQLVDRTRHFVIRVFKRVGWTRFDTLFDSLQRFDGVDVKSKPEPLELNIKKGTETADHPPSPSIFDIIPGVEDEVDVESELMSVEEWDGCSQTLIEDHCPVTRSKDLKLRNEEDITSSAELQDIVETTSDTSTDNSEPVLIQEWREAQRTRRKRGWQRYTQEKTNDFPRFKRLILKINKLKTSEIETFQAQ